MGSQKICIVKVLIAFGQLQRHRVHLSRLHFHSAFTLQSQNVSTTLPVISYKVEMVAVNANALQIMRLSEAYQSPTDILKGEGDLGFANLEQALVRFCLSCSRPDSNGLEDTV